MAVDNPREGGDFFVQPDPQDPWSREPDIVYRSDCHPGVQRPIAIGDPAWTIRIPLEDGRLLEVQMGQRGHDDLRKLFMMEALDDEVDAIAAHAEEALLGDSGSAES